jgi:hypothetical protein
MMERVPQRGSYLVPNNHASISTMFYVVFAVISFTFSTVSLAAALWIIGEEETDPFKTDGMGPTMAKCAGICAVTTGLSFVPFGGLLCLIIWFGSVMTLFNKSFFGAVLVALVGGVVSGSQRGSFVA